MFQGVHNMWQFDAAEVAEDKKDSHSQRINKFVMIGRNLNKEEIKKDFMACMLQQPETVEALAA